MLKRSKAPFWQDKDYDQRRAKASIFLQRTNSFFSGT
jgi:hypothetical protein